MAITTLTSRKQVPKCSLLQREFFKNFLRLSFPILFSSERNKAIRGLEVKFRVPFVVTDISGRDSKIGNGQHVINMLVLDFTSELFVNIS